MLNQALILAKLALLQQPALVRFRAGTRCVQLGGKGFGEPLTFDAAYYKTLLQKPWADPKAEMGSMIG